MPARLFERYIGIDYSGAETAESSLKGLRVYRADDRNPPEPVPPPPSPRWYWSRREIAEWLASLLDDGIPSLVGIDHGFSFPEQYFQKYRLPRNWHSFLDDFHAHWPTDTCGYVDFVRDGHKGNGAARTGNRKWRRLTEVRAGGAKSVFHFDVPGSVAKSTHAGLPWLRYIRDQAGDRVHFWPFDGWLAPPGKSVLAEVYPSLWKDRFPVMKRTPDEQDAYAIAAWMRKTDAAGELERYLCPPLDARERTVAQFEGWILGVL